MEKSRGLRLIASMARRPASGRQVSSGMGDVPEDRNWFEKPQIQAPLRKDRVPPSIEATLLQLAETYMMAPQQVVPVFAKPVKITTSPTGVFIPIYTPPPSWQIVLEYKVPSGYAAVITLVHQELESPNAYKDVGVRLLYRTTVTPNWHPQKPQAVDVKIVLFHEEVISLQVRNINPFVPHNIVAEFVGYEFQVNAQSKCQTGLKVNTTP